MKWLLGLLVLCILYESITCPPVDKKKENVKKDEGENKEDDDDDMVNKLSYQRYLKEVFTILSSDDSFRLRLENTSDINKESGEIAQHLDFVHHSVRTKLDELKRREVDRLKLLSKIKHGKTNGIRIMDPEVAKHVDHINEDTFEVHDLQKLIQQATRDLEEIDDKRKKEFKEYELEKEVEHRDKVRHLDEKAKVVEEDRWKAMKKKHKEHPKLHHPGSKDQLEEVWEEKDHMDKESFDPKTFFSMHDINGDGELDTEEIEALFERELAKVYDENAEEDDLVEREEERNRMREHVFSEVDTDRDGMISLKEFLQSTDQKEFSEDQGWKTLDEDPAYTDDELEEFEREFLNEQENQKKQWEDHADGLQQPGVVQDHMAGDQQGQVHQMDQGQFQQAPHGQQQFQQPPQGQQQFQQPPQGQQQFQQPPQGQQQFRQPQHQPEQQHVPQQQEHHQQAQPQAGQQQHQQEPVVAQGQPVQQQQQHNQQDIQHLNVQHIQENVPQDPNAIRHPNAVPQHNQQDLNVAQQHQQQQQQQQQ